MIVSERLLVWVIAAEAAVLVVLFVWLAVRAALFAIDRRFVEPRIEEARRRLTRELVSERTPRADGEERSIRPRHRREALLRLAPHLSGGSSSRLREGARELGMVAAARRLSRSRISWRRLRGIQLLDVFEVDDPAARRLVKDPAPWVRARAVEWLGDVASRPEDVEDLMDALHDPEPLVRYSAADALLRVGHRAVEPVRVRLLDPDRAVPGRLMEVVAGLGSPVFLSPVLERIRGLGTEGRLMGARYLGKVGGDVAAEVLVDLLRDTAAEVRAEAASSLGLLGIWKAGPDLARLVGDPVFDVRRSAAMALVSLGPPGRLVLRRVARSDRREERDMARQILDLPASVGRRA